MGTSGGRECEIVEANATRYCNPYGVWEDPDTTKCYTQVTQAMCEIRNVSMFSTDRYVLLHDVFFILCKKVDKKKLHWFLLVYRARPYSKREACYLRFALKVGSSSNVHVA